MARYYGPGSTGALAGVKPFAGWDAPTHVLPGGIFQHGASAGSYGNQGPQFGPLTTSGIMLQDGNVVFGTRMPNGTIVGQMRTPDGRTVQGTFGMDPTGRSVTSVSESAAGGGGGGGGDAALEEQRRLAFGSLNQGANYFNSPLGNQTYNSLSNTQAGLDVPYTQDVQDRLFTRQADLNAGQEAGMQDRIRASFNDRGMGGSGGELAAMLGAARERGAANTAAESDIANRAQLENFGARERARGESAQFMSSRSAAEAPYRLKEADLRSRFEVTGQSPLGALGGMLGMGGGSGYQGNAARTGPSGFQAQSSADAMARGRNGGILNGQSGGGVVGQDAGFSYVSQQGGAPTTSPQAGGGFQRATGYPQGGSPWGMSQAFMQAPFTPTNNLAPAPTSYNAGVPQQQQVSQQASYTNPYANQAGGLGGWRLF